MFVCVLFAASLFAGCSSKNENQTYAVSGIILDENQAPVEGVSVDGGEYGVVTTNEKGEYVFSNIKNGLIVKPSKEGYHFAEKSKFVAAASTSANFVASKEYTVTGTIANNGSGLAGEAIYFTSLANPASDNCVVTSDENGNFTITGVAGKTVVSYDFNGGSITDEATINQTDVSLELTSSIRLAFEFDTSNVDVNDISVKIGGVSYTLDYDYEISESGLKFNDLVEISSSVYDFDIVRFNLTNQYDYKVIKAYKKYKATGVVMSGSVLLNGADVFVDKVFATSTNSEGLFEIDNLTQDKIITVFYSGLEFESSVVNHKNTGSMFNGTKDVTLSLNCDYPGYDELVFSGVSATTSNKKDYLVEDVHFGDTIEFSSSVYHLSTNSFVVSKNDIYFAEGEVKYNAEVSGLEDGFNLLIDGVVSNADALQGIHGEHMISASFEDYIFSEHKISAPNRVVNLSYKVPYSATIIAKSGELELASAKATIASDITLADANGKIELSGLVDSVEVKISCEGYNSQTLTISTADKNTEKTVNLTYDISGYAKTGDIAVAYANVSVSDKTAVTNTAGYFEIKNLAGENQLNITKENNTFAAVTVSKSAVVEVQGTFKVFGVLENDNGFVSGKTITLIPSDESLSEQTTVSDENGYYEFIGLASKYTLTSADTSSSELLRPYSYVVTVGGEYNFRSTGFAVSGKITTGDVPIEGVLVKAGSSIVYTNASGEYEFGLLSSDCEVSAEKEGYVFSDPILVSDNAENVNFTATYSISGRVTSGTQPVQNVLILLNGESQNLSTNENGEFVLTGLSGANNVVSYQKSGLIFDSTNTVSAYGTIAVSCKVHATIAVKTGSVEVSDFDYFANGTKLGSSKTSTITINANYGDIISFEKTGYQIQNVVISFENSYTANATYSIVGYTLSNDVVIEGVAVTAGETTILSDMSGKFTFSGLVGETQITFEKQGFSFETKSVSAYNSNLVANGTFVVTGQVKVLGLKALEGVEVYHLSQKIATTDAEGKFTATVSGYYTLGFVKEGYTIASVENKFGSQNFVVVAFYSISGTVKSGDLLIEGAKVDLYLEGSSIPVSTTTDENGYYEFNNITAPAVVTVSKSGYASVSSDKIADLKIQNFDIAYSVTLVFAGGVKDVSVYVNGIKYTASSSSIKLDGLTGTTTIKLEKKNTDFDSYNEFKVNSPATLEIVSRVSYNVTGYVKSQASKLAVTGITMQAGTKTTVTDSNGYFEFSSVAGTLQIKESGIESNKPTIDHDGDYSEHFLVSETEFALLLVNRGYKNLDEASSVQIYANGVVNPNTSMAGAQYVSSMYKRDTKGNILKQNLNYGKEIMNVNPCVALLVYKDNSGTTPSYQYIKHQNVSLDTTTASVNIYNKNSSSLTTVSLSVPTASYCTAETGYFASTSATSLKSTFGSTPEEYSSASLVGATCERVSFDGTNYTFMLKLSTSQSSYRNQIEALSPGSHHQRFDSLKHYYKITKDGWIVELNADEQYVITQDGLGSLVGELTIYSDIVYTFHTRNKNTTIADIDVSNTSAITNSLAFSTQTIAEASEPTLKSFDVISKVIFG